MTVPPPPPCPPVIVIAHDAPVTCDPDGAQILVEVGGTVDDCLHTGGVPVQIVGVVICIGVDY